MPTGYSTNYTRIFDPYAVIHWSDETQYFWVMNKIKTGNCD